MVTKPVMFLRWGIVVFLLPVVVMASSKTPTKKNQDPLAQSSAKPTPAGHAPNLDTARIRKLYMDGDFEEAIAILEKELADKPPFTHEDSVFIFKHLGVMYAAKYETREMGKKYMFLLLMTEPTAKIMDMYASDMIYMIFKNIQEEFEMQRGRYAHAKDLVAGNQQNDSVPKQPPPEEKPKPKTSEGGHALVWVGATGVVAAAGVAAYFLLSPGGTKTTQHNHSLDGL